MVKKGDVIARIDMPQLIVEINSRQRALLEKESKGQDDSSEYKAIENQVLELREELDYKSQIVSPIDGRILEINMNKGSIVNPGESLLALEQYGSTVKLEAVIYVAAMQGERILPGMEVQISPAIVNKEEYGFMLGRVASVSTYPATIQSMMQTLDNENLVSLLVGQGVPMMIRVDLIPDAKTESGYKWSSPKGPPISIHSGTLIKCEVITNRQKPISKVIPVSKIVVN
jgi:NHLM bacteriocin system secretion protein